MKNKDQGYCMKFSNGDIKSILVDYVQKTNHGKVDIVAYSKDHKIITLEDQVPIKTIAFGDNIMIDFMGKQTSIFVCNEEIMFIDEDAKRYSYTVSDLYGNAVYEDKIGLMEHHEMLKMFAEIIICLINAETIDILEEPINNDKYDNKYYYIDELKKYTVVGNKKYNSTRQKVFSNITIKY